MFPFILIALAAGLVAIFGFKKVSNNINTSVTLEQKLRNTLPPRLARWSVQIASATVGTLPSDFTPEYWASIIAGVIDQESYGSETLAPKNDPSGVGDFTNRWRTGPPGWTTSDMITGQTRLDMDGLRYEISPPQPFDDRIPAWGYGLMQHDWEFNTEYINSNAWRDPQSNITKGAAKLASNYASTGDISSAIARYNGRGNAAKLYAQKVLSRSSNYGVA